MNGHDTRGQSRFAAPPRAPRSQESDASHRFHSEDGEIERAGAVDDGVLRIVTAGSVDDGKSTLIGRLLHDSRAILEDQLAAVARASSRRGHDGLDLSLLTDGLEAEREQGITIDVAYRYFATPRRKFILADSPGHEQYTRNMVTGASTADVALLLIDARKSVLPQTRRHTYLAHLLGIRHVFVVVNKMDLVGYDRATFEAIREAFLRFAAPLAIRDLRFFPISALAGDLVVERGDRLDWHAGPSLLEALETVPVQDEAAALPARFAVQLVIRDDAGGSRRYAGRLASGALCPGDAVVVLPAGRRTTVRDILGFEGPRAAAVAGDSIALTLARDVDVARGDLLAAADDPPRAARTLHATVCWLDEDPLRPEARYLLKAGTRTVAARIAAVTHKLDVQTLQPAPADGPIGMNEVARLRLDLQQPIAADAYDANRETGAFVLIDPVTHRTVAAGLIGA
jgi:sulfate adenylyltransferase large subunit